MHDTTPLLLAALAGAALGGFFFGGLWWTLRRGLASERPALWHLGSLLLRMGLTLPGFYVVADGQWQRLLTSLVGFVIARSIVLRITRPAASGHGESAQEAGHAPQP
jgi:F1F0 ATPase subunit 2